MLAAVTAARHTSGNGNCMHLGTCLACFEGLSKHASNLSSHCELRAIATVPMMSKDPS